MSRDEIEDGMGFSGLVPSRRDREENKRIQTLEAKLAWQAEMLERAKSMVGVYDSIAKLDLSGMKWLRDLAKGFPGGAKE